MSAKILLVDDEPDILDLLKYNLEKEGFACATAKNGVEAMRLMPSFNPNLVLLDIMMPEMDGMETCKQIRANNQYDQTFIVFLTARNEEYSELAGFESGADDYISKPIKPRVLISRIKAILNRDSRQAAKDEVLTVGDIVIDLSTYTISIRNKEVNFPKKEFQLLTLLASRPGKVFTRESILSQVWGDNVYVVDRTIDVHIRKIREKIGDKKIKTIKGVGYKFEL